MSIRVSLSLLSVVLAGVFLAGCTKQDGKVILGRWQAERVDMMGLKLPIGPDLDIRTNKVLTLDAELPITAIEQDGDKIVLDGPHGVGLTFHIADVDRIYVQVPFFDRIYFRRVKTAAPEVAAVQTHEPQAVLKLPPSASGGEPSSLAKPIATTAALAAYMQTYDAAVLAARQGQADIALRYLHQAVQQGFNRFDLLEHEAGFEALQSDPRYQVIVLQMPKR